MSDVPEDIRAAAFAVVERGYDEGLVDAVCRALMVERERCAQISIDMCSHRLPAWADEIAAAIRRGTA